MANMDKYLKLFYIQEKKILNFETEEIEQI
jgi:hypothetical protein